MIGWFRRRRLARLHARQQQEAAAQAYRDAWTFEIQRGKNVTMGWPYDMWLREAERDGELHMGEERLP